MSESAREEPTYAEKVDHIKDDLNHLRYVTRDPKNGERISLLIHIISRIETKHE